MTKSIPPGLLSVEAVQALLGRAVPRWGMCMWHVREHDTWHACGYILYICAMRNVYYTMWDLGSSIKRGR